MRHGTRLGGLTGSGERARCGRRGGGRGHGHDDTGFWFASWLLRIRRATTTVPAIATTTSAPSSTASRRRPVVEGATAARLILRFLGWRNSLLGSLFCSARLCCERARVVRGDGRRRGHGRRRRHDLGWHVAVELFDLVFANWSAVRASVMLLPIRPTSTTVAGVPSGKVMGVPALKRWTQVHGRVLD